MRFNEYFKNNNLIITPALVNKFSFLTQDGADSINLYFKYELGDLFMYKDDSEEVEEMADYILTKNAIEYSNLAMILNKNYANSLNKTAEIIKTPSNITESETPSNITEEITPSNITENHTPSNQTKTKTPSNITESHTPSNLTEQITPGQISVTHKPAEETETHTPAGTTLSKNTTQAGTKGTITSTKPFDSSSFVETEKIEETDSPPDEEEVLTIDSNETKTNVINSNETTTTTEQSTTRTTSNTTESKSTSFTQESEQITNTNENKTTTFTKETKETEYTERVKETEYTNETVEELRINEMLSNAEALKNIFLTNLWNKICEDLKVVLAIRVYSLCPFDY